MSFKLGNTSQQRLIGVHPDLVRVVRRAIELSSMDFAVNEGLRTAERQRRLVASGASQTLNSKHLKQADGFGHAVDIVPWGDFDGNGALLPAGGSNASGCQGIRRARALGWLLAMFERYQQECAGVGGGLQRGAAGGGEKGVYGWAAF